MIFCAMILPLHWGENSIGITEPERKATGNEISYDIVDAMSASQ